MEHAFFRNLGKGTVVVLWVTVAPLSAHTPAGLKRGWPVYAAIGFRYFRHTEFISAPHMQSSRPAPRDPETSSGGR